MGEQRVIRTSIKKPGIARFFYHTRFFTRPAFLRASAVAGWLLVPQEVSEDNRRRGVVLNVLLLANIMFCLLAAAISLHESVVLTHRFMGEPPLTSLLIGAILALFYVWSRRRFFPAMATMLVAIFVAAGMYTLYQWGITLPQGLLILAFAIVLAGIVLPRRAGGAVGALIIVTLLVLSYLDAHGIITPDRRWVAHKPIFPDGITFAVTLFMIGLVSWLSSLEIERLIVRTRSSEQELKRERDALETTVAERTRQLEEAQIVRLMELQRFSELGRLSAGIMHDMSSPLTAALLNLDAMASERHSELLARVKQNIDYVGRYVRAARRQLMAGSDNTNFTVIDELNLVVTVLAHKSRQQRVSIDTSSIPPHLTVYGDAVCFDQLAANLISNAIEAYNGSPVTGPRRRVAVTATTENGQVVLRVADFGRGFEPDKNVFAPFYSTKGAHSGNMGLGLSIAKRLAEEVFGGTIAASSSPRDGTVFTVTFGGNREDNPA